MSFLPSGLPEHVDSGEPLARFIFRSRDFSGNGVKARAFLPNPAHRNTSVFRLPGDPERLNDAWSAARNPTDDRPLYGAALILARDVRNALLDVIAREPPNFHADIVNWPWQDRDPEEEKAKRLSCAGHLAMRARFVSLDGLGS